MSADKNSHTTLKCNREFCTGVCTNICEAVLLARHIEARQAEKVAQLANIDAYGARTVFSVSLPSWVVECEMIAASVHASLYDGAPVTRGIARMVAEYSGSGHVPALDKIRRSVKELFVTKYSTASGKTITRYEMLGHLAQMLSPFGYRTQECLIQPWYKSTILTQLNEARTLWQATQIARTDGYDAVVDRFYEIILIVWPHCASDAYVY